MNLLFDIVPVSIYFYVVTALDRVNNESPPSNEAQVVIPQFSDISSTRIKVGMD